MLLRFSKYAEVQMIASLFECPSISTLGGKLLACEMGGGLWAVALDNHPGGVNPRVENI
jgi:hypothetical protein